RSGGQCQSALVLLNQLGGGGAAMLALVPPRLAAVKLGSLDHSSQLRGLRARKVRGAGG
ncbi:hypothetical protein E4U43_001928, partial [Claviceps pusilla]